MKILVLAPQPFFQQRGTPIATDLLLSALSARGDEVDVLTFHLGEDRSYPGVRIIRIDPPFAPETLGAGFSLGKVYCDFFLLRRAISLMKEGRYDLIHAIEESVFVAMLLSSLYDTPYVYDMDSSMPTQLLGRFRWLRVAERPLRSMEALAMRRAAAVVPMCESLAEQARQHCDGLVEVVSDVSLLPDSQDHAEDIRSMLHARGPIIMYVGNFERYQGLWLLLDAFAAVLQTHPDTQLVIIGGNSQETDGYRQKMRATFMGNHVHFLGQRPLSALGSYLEQADILVSPRTEGDNTPLKLYSYLDSGVPVVATDIPAHTQVVSTEEVAFTPVDAEAMASELRRLLDDPEERERVAQNARALIERQYSLHAFHRNVRRVFGKLEHTVGGNH